MKGGFRTERPGLILSAEEERVILQARHEAELERQREFQASIAEDFTITDGGPVEVTLFKHGSVILSDPDNHWESISVSEEAFRRIVVRWFAVRAKHRRDG